MIKMTLFRKEDEQALIRQLYIEPTSRCNLSCKMCFRHSWIDEKMGDMSEEVFKSVLSYIKAYKPETVFFGGMGEPLIHSDICGYIKRIKPYVKNIELITNASLLTADMSERLISAGLDTLWISMDGFDREEYEKIRLGGRFQKITENIKEFNRMRKDKGVKLGITFVVMEENVENLEKIDGFADEYSVDILNISHAIPGEENEGARDFYESFIPVGKMRRFSEGVFSDKKDFCPFVEEGMCFVKWNGEVVPCMQVLHSCTTFMFSVKREVYCHSFGNVTGASLYDIYRSDEYKNFRNTVLNFDFPSCTVCEGCEMRESNIEDCMYNEKPTCGACLWSTGKIRCP